MDKPQAMRAFQESAHGNFIAITPQTHLNGSKQRLLRGHGAAGARSNVSGNQDIPEGCGDRSTIRLN